MYYSRLTHLEAVRSPCLIKKLSRVVFAAHKREISTKDDDSKKKYSSTVILPKTTFPGYIKANQLAKRDQTVAEVCAGTYLKKYANNMFAFSSRNAVSMICINGKSKI
jgi:hypothetical protein